MAATKSPNSLKNLEKGSRFGRDIDPVAAQNKGARTKSKKGILKKVILSSLEHGEITYEDIGKTVIKEAHEGKSWAVEMIYEMSENFQNRKLKIQQKDTKTKEDLIAHLQGIKLKNPVEMGEEIPYEELDRPVE